MVKYDKEEKRLIIPADINYYSLEEYKRGYQEGYEDGYASGITACTHYEDEYFTIEALRGGTITPRKAIDYSVNGGGWETTTGEFSISVNSGDKVRFRGTSGGKELFKENDIAFNVYGNIESLEYGDDFIGKDRVLTGFLAFDHMFDGCGNLVDASNLILPATTLAFGCYAFMFASCRKLISAPKLPATTLVESCYSNMFGHCISLTTAPVLPATTLGRDCYSSMFVFCTSLTEAPELPATTLPMVCYSFMFDGCTNINYIKCLATNIETNLYTAIWTRDVSPTGTFVTPSTTAWETGVNGIPEGWTRVDA